MLPIVPCVVFTHKGRYDALTPTKSTAHGRPTTPISGSEDLCRGARAQSSAGAVSRTNPPSRVFSSSHNIKLRISNRHISLFRALTMVLQCPKYGHVLIPLIANERYSGNQQTAKRLEQQKNLASVSKDSDSLALLDRRPFGGVYQPNGLKVSTSQFNGFKVLRS